MQNQEGDLIVQTKSSESLKPPFQEELAKLGYQLIQQLGTGAFAQVWQVQRKNNFFAIKIISKAVLLEQPFLLTYIQSEMESMKSIRSRNTVQMYECFQDNFYFYLVMECCENNLLTFLKTETNSTGLCESDAVKLFAQILEGLLAIHREGYLHRDLKPENILLRGKQLKIADFGFAKAVSASNGMASTFCGTDEFMAPEIHMHLKYNYKVDIWAIGVLLFVMIFYKFPFSGNNVMMEIKRFTENKIFSVEEVLSGCKRQHVLQKIQTLSPQIRDLFARIFVFDFNQRIDFIGIYEHPLFSKYKIDEFYKQKNDSLQFYKMEFHQKERTKSNNFDSAYNTFCSKQKNSEVSIQNNRVFVGNDNVLFQQDEDCNVDESASDVCASALKDSGIVTVNLTKQKLIQINKNTQGALIAAEVQQNDNLLTAQVMGRAKLR